MEKEKEIKDEKIEEYQEEEIKKEEPEKEPTKFVDIPFDTQKSIKELWVGEIKDIVTKDNYSFYKELGSDTLTSVGNNITISNIAAKEHLQIKIHIVGVSAGDRVEIQFNDDTGNNYDNYTSLNGVGEANNGIDSLIINASSIYTGAKSAYTDIWNRKSYDKMANGIFYSVSNAICLHGGRWINTSNQINKIKVFLNSGNNMSIGSKVVVWGKD